MARTVTYSVVPRINPREKNDPPKYYAQAQARGGSFFSRGLIRGTTEYVTVLAIIL